MVGTKTGRVALFSIHPRYADAILAGNKRVEFRRQGLPDDVTHIVVYATAPTQRVVGSFRVAEVERVSPSLAWSRYRHMGGIDKDAFDAYYAGAAAAYVIHVDNPTPFGVPFPLSAISEDLRPPQSYMYLTGDRLERLVALSAPHRTRPSIRILGDLVGQAGRRLAPALKH